MAPDDWRLIFEGVVAMVALAGFVLSLVGLWFTWWMGRPRVQVTMTVAILARADGVGPTMFMLTAFNAGRVPVALTGVGVDIYDHGQAKSSAFFMGPPPFAPPLPFVLQAGRAWNYHVDPEQVLEAHRSDRGPVLGPFVNDEGGHHWSSRTKQSWLEAWARKASG